MAESRAEGGKRMIFPRFLSSRFVSLLEPGFLDGFLRGETSGGGGEVAEI
jgi:hypothetical protein